MQTIENQLPPIAQALGRLRHPRGWPYAPRPVELSPTTPQPDPTTRTATHDFLCIVPEPALTGDLPPLEPLRETARPYWFDL